MLRVSLPCGKGGRSYRPQEFSQTQVSVYRTARTLTILCQKLNPPLTLWTGRVEVLPVNLLCKMSCVACTMCNVYCTCRYPWNRTLFELVISLIASVFCEFHWTRYEDAKQQCLLSHGEYSSVDPLYMQLPHVCDLQSDYKFFNSPTDYGEKVMGKIREFNGSMEQVYS